MSGGNPMFALLLGRALVGRSASSPGAELALPDTLLHLVGDRLAGLGPAIEAVQVAAVLSRPSASGITAVLGRGAVATQTSERPRRQACWPSTAIASSSGIPCSPPRPTRGSVVVGDDLHALRVAATLDDVEERARHLALAAVRPNSDVAEALDSAARRAGAAPDAAAELWEAAARLTPDDQQGRPANAGWTPRGACSSSVVSNGHGRSWRKSSPTPRPVPRVPARSPARMDRGAHRRLQQAAQAFRSALDELEPDSPSRSTSAKDWRGRCTNPTWRSPSRMQSGH